MTTIKTIDLLAINEYAKAIKQNNVIIIGNIMIGLDYINTYITYIDNIVLSDDYTNMIFIKKDLSKFVKSISHELEFEIDSNNMIKSLVLDMQINYADRRLLLELPKYLSLINKYGYIQQGEDITDKLDKLFSMKKPDGMFKYIYENYNRKYFMTLYPGLLPVNKNDKVSLNIVADSNNIFTTKFIISKKKINNNSATVNMIMSFLNLV